MENISILLKYFDRIIGRSRSLSGDRSRGRKRRRSLSNEMYVRKRQISRSQKSLKHRQAKRNSSSESSNSSDHSSLVNFLKSLNYSCN